MQFYTSVFKNAKPGTVTRYGEGGPAPAGSVMSATFTLEGQEFFALNGGPHYQFTPAISFFVSCENQEEIDQLWSKLSADPSAEQCGWLKDKFGLSWQIIPSNLSQLLGQKDPEKAKKVMMAMMQMKKIDIAALQQAAQ